MSSSDVGGVKTAPSKRSPLSAENRQYIILSVFLLVLVSIFASRHDRFLTLNNFSSLISVLAVLGIVTLGQLCALIVGGFDLSTGGVVPLAGVAYALLLNANYGIVLAAILAVGLGVLVGVLNGVLITYLKINPLITTLGTLQVTGGLALTLTGGVQIRFEDRAGGWFAAGSPLGIPTEAWIFLILAAVTYVLLARTTYGRRLYAVGDSQETARLAGIRTRAVTVSAYTVSAGLSAVAGLVLASQLLTGSGVSGTDTNLQSLAAAILGGAILGGGRGTVIGTLLGVLTIGILKNGMTLLLVPAFYQTIATGVVLLIAVAVSQLNLKRATRT